MVISGVERINAGDVKQGETLCVKQRGRYAMGLTGFLPHLDKRASTRTVSFELIRWCKPQTIGDILAWTLARSIGPVRLSIAPHYHFPGVSKMIAGVERSE
jgi:hypothetical protein